MITSSSLVGAFRLTPFRIVEDDTLSTSMISTLPLLVEFVDRCKDERAGLFPIRDEEAPGDATRGPSS